MALTDSLSFCLECDEASGTLVDAHSGGRDFTAVNSPGAGTGVLSGCRTFAAGSVQYASRADEAAIRPGAAFTFAAWILQPSSVSGNSTIWSKWDGAGGPILETASGDGTNLKMFHTNSGSDLITTSGLGLTADVYCHVAVTFDGSGSTDADKVKVYANASALSLSFSGAAVTSDFSGKGDSSAFYLCAWPTIPRYGTFYLDQVCFWQRALSATEIATVYNAGAGLVYPWTTAATSCPAAYLAQARQHGGAAMCSRTFARRRSGLYAPRRELVGV